MHPWLSVLEAADELDVQDRQVRNLLAHGSLEGRRVGRAWLVSAASVNSLKQQRPSAGRPLAAGSAWKLLLHLDQALSPASEPVPPPADRRDRYRLKKLLRSLPDADDLSPKLRCRAAANRMWFHPAAVERIAADPRVQHCDPSSELGVDVSDIVPWYVAESDFDAVVADHHGRHVDDPQPVDGEHRVMSVPDVDDDVNWRDHLIAASILDLASHPDARVRSAAKDRLRHAVEVAAASVDPGP